MKKMVKIALAIVMVSLIGFSFAACGGGGGGGGGGVTIASNLIGTWKSDSDGARINEGGYNNYTDNHSVTIEVTATTVRWKCDDPECAEENWGKWTLIDDFGDDNVHSLGETTYYEYITATDEPGDYRTLVRFVIDPQDPAEEISISTGEGVMLPNDVSGYFTKQ